MKKNILLLSLLLFMLGLLSYKKQVDKGIMASFYFTADIDGQKIIFEGHFKVLINGIIRGRSVASVY